MGVALHLLNADRQLDAVLGHIERAFERTISAVSTLLDLQSINVVIRADSSVIPETGMVGYSPSANAVYMALDPNNDNLLKDFDTEFVATLGHEFHHCKRHGGPGYGRTLGDVLVTEGLACHFETELRGGGIPFYARALDACILEDMWTRAKLELKTASYDHRGWFFGSPQKGIPRHSGYSLGFSIVARYIQNSGVPASCLWQEAADTFYGAA